MAGTFTQGQFSGNNFCTFVANHQPRSLAISIQLYTNQIDIRQSVTLGSFTEADFYGYRRFGEYPVVSSVWPVRESSSPGNYLIRSAPCFYRPSKIGKPNSIWGFYLVAALRLNNDPLSYELVGFSQFSAARPMVAVSDTIEIIVQLRASLLNIAPE